MEAEATFLAIAEAAQVVMVVVEAGAPIVTLHKGRHLVALRNAQFQHQHAICLCRHAKCQRHRHARCQCPHALHNAQTCRQYNNHAVLNAPNLCQCQHQHDAITVINSQIVQIMIVEMADTWGWDLLEPQVREPVIKTINRK